MMNCPMQNTRLVEAANKVKEYCELLKFAVMQDQNYAQLLKAAQGLYKRCGDDGELHVVTSFDTEDGARALMRHKYEEYRAKNNLLQSDFTWQHGFKKNGCKHWTCYDNKNESPHGEWIIDEVEVGDGDAESAKEVLA